MAHSVTHAKVSAVADSGNASLVQPSDWNAAHTVTVDASLVDHGSLAGLSDDDHTSYHTDARALTWLGTRSTTDLPEGTNLYYTDVRADARVAVHTGDTTDAHAASAITNTAAGNISATTVQAAINELDTEKQPLDSELTALAGLTSAADRLPYFTGSGTAALATFTSAARDLLDDANAGAMLTTLGAQASDAELTALAGLTSAADKVPYFTGSGTAAVADFSSVARTLVAQTTQANMRSTGLGLGTAATQNTGTSGANVPLLNGSNVWASPQEISNTGGASVLIFRRPEVHGDNAAVGSFSGRGQDSAGNSETYVQTVMYALSDNSGAEQGGFYIQTLVSGASQNTVAIGPGMQLGAPTGGDKGFGTLNAVGVYDDNTLLTCYVFDAALDGGTIDLKKWDDLVPNVDYIDTITKERVFQERTHEPLRKFAARIGGPEDPLDLDKYINHWKTKRHLTSMPNEANFDPVKGLPTGAWIQRLVETVEIQAVHIAQLHERLKAIGA